MFCSVYDKFAQKHTRLGKNEKVNFPVGEFALYGRVNYDNH